MHLIHDIDQILSIVVYLWLQGFPKRVHTTELISHDHELKYLLRNSDRRRLWEGNSNQDHMASSYATCLYYYSGATFICFEVFAMVLLDPIKVNSYEQNICASNILIHQQLHMKLIYQQITWMHPITKNKQQILRVLHVTSSFSPSYSSILFLFSSKDGSIEK